MHFAMIISIYQKCRTLIIALVVSGVVLTSVENLRDTIKSKQILCLTLHANSAMSLQCLPLYARCY